MKMLWITLLTLLVPDQDFALALPFRVPDLATVSNAGPWAEEQVFSEAHLMSLPPEDRHPSTQSHADPSEADLEFAQEYLQHFFSHHPGAGERQKRSAGDDWTTGLCDKLKKMQHFFGLPPSGELTQETLAVMRKPRCGLSDVEHFEGTTRWKKKTLSYRIVRSNLPFSAAKVYKVFKSAWQLWSNVIPVRFHKRNRKEADIIISFHQTDHKDGTPFDGKGGILAHAFFPGPGIGGDVHFDAEEDWSINSTGFSLFAVAAHEFGHALGLAHSSDLGAVMYPAYNFSPNYELRLSLSDVKHIQRLYGICPDFDPPPRTPDKCHSDLSFDAVTELQQEVLYFKDRFMWRKHPQFDEIGMTMISSLWSDSVPASLDAVYQNVEKNLMVFFKGHQYWVVRGHDLEKGFPRNISDFGFPSRVKSVDAALHFRDKRYTVFFTGQECWKYDEQRRAMHNSPSLLERQWPGVEAPIDAAVFYDGFVHFFKGNLHFQFDNNSKSLISVSTVNEVLECNKILTKR